MKKKIINILLAAAFFTVPATAQKVKTTSGSDDVLKPETSIKIEFTYDDMSVGKYKTEAEYVNAKTEEYNKKEAGRGDSWAKKWKDDRKGTYEPKFIDLFTQTSGMTVSDKAKYTLIFKTRSIEPGYNIAGGMMIGGRKNAQIDAEIWIVETANPSNKVASFTIDNVPGGTFLGNDFDSATRIGESYAKAGKTLGKFFK